MGQWGAKYHHFWPVAEIRSFYFSSLPSKNGGILRPSAPQTTTSLVFSKRRSLLTIRGVKDRRPAPAKRPSPNFTRFLVYILSGIGGSITLALRICGTPLSTGEDAPDVVRLSDKSMHLLQRRSRCLTPLKRPQCLTLRSKVKTPVKARVANCTQSI